MLKTVQALAVPILLSSSAASLQEAKAFEDELARAIDLGRRGMIEHMLETGRAPGSAVAVAIGECVVWEEGFGTAHLEQDVAASAATRFGLGSLSKVLTMVCAERLAEEGRLDLDVPVEAILPDFPFVGEGITLRRLAAHQSGLTDEVAALHADSDVSYPTLEAAYQAVIAGERIVAEPGTEIAYANGTYTILARAMEVAAEESYLELMQRYVLGPAGMDRTTPDDRKRIVAGRSGFYHMLAEGRFENARHHDSSIKLPAAGWLSTAGDMARFGGALLSGELLATEAARDFFSTVPFTDGTPTEYGLGLRYTEDEGRPVWHHPGGGHGISCWILLYPEQELTIVILSNCNQGPVGGAVMDVLSESFVRVAELAR